MTSNKDNDRARNIHLGEMEQCRELMAQSRKNKNHKAFNDAKKHYDKLVNQLKIYDKAMGYDK